MTMGKTTDSFKREIGKNVGKAVSTWIFKDAHATPYRRAGDIQRKTSESQADATEATNQRLHKEQMFSLDAAVLKNIDTIANIRVPDHKEDLIALLSELSVHLEANRWGSVEDADKEDKDEVKIRNKFCDALLSKYIFCLKKLQNIDNSEYQLFYFESLARKAKRNRFMQRYKIELLTASLILVIFILFWIFSPEDKALITKRFIIFMVAVSSITALAYLIFNQKQKRLKKIRSIQ